MNHPPVETVPVEYALAHDIALALAIRSKGDDASLFNLGRLYQDTGETTLAEVLLLFAGLLIFANREEAIGDDEDQECWRSVASLAMQRGDVYTAQAAIARVQSLDLRRDLQEQLNRQV
ncbi:MAG: hypothetical protein ACRDX8_00680 [Acidimicrobiales bacterium]